MVDPYIFRYNYHDFRSQLDSIRAKQSQSGHLPHKIINIEPESLLESHDWAGNRTYAFEPKRLKNLPKSAMKKTAAPMELPEIGIPGVRNMLNAKYSIWGKLIWFAVLICSTSICIYQVADRFCYYLSFPLTAEVSNIINKSLVFPMVSLCPYNPFQRNKAVLHFKRELSKKLGVPVKGMEDLWRHMPNESYNLEDLWNMTMMAEPIISVKCGFGRKAEECNFEFELKEQFKTFFGYCWIIGKKDNNDPIDYQGPMTGLTIKVPEAEDSLKIHLKTIKKYSNGDMDDQSIGYSVYIHDNETSPKYDAFYRGITIYHSVNTILALNIKQFEFLNTTQHPCSSSKVVSDCWDDCIERRILQAVSCRLPFIEDTPLYMCNGTEDYNSSYLAPRYIYLAATPENCDCPRRCEKTIYTPNQYTIRDPNFPNRTMISIFFQDNMYEYIKEMEAFTFIAFLSDVGGTLGLFLGICILTLGEMMEIVIILLKRCILERKCICTVEEE